MIFDSGARITHHDGAGSSRSSALPTKASCFGARVAAFLVPVHHLEMMEEDFVSCI